MQMHQPIEAEAGGDGLKTQAVAEALKGEREVDEIASDAGVTGSTLRTWLYEHHSSHPDDTRSALDESSGDITAARETMSRKAKKRNRSKRNAGEAAASPQKNEFPPELKALVVAQVLANRKLPGEKQRTQRSIGEEHGVSEALVSQWVNTHLQSNGLKEITRRGVRSAYRDLYEKFADEIRKTGEAPYKVGRRQGLSNSTIHRWTEVFEKEQRDLGRKAGLEKARAARLEKLKDPEYREAMRQRNWRNNREDAEQLELPSGGGEATMVSSAPLPQLPPPTIPPPSAARSNGYRSERPSFVRPRPEQQSERDEFINESFKECVEERNTLRGMVKILQRERDDFEKKVATYQRRFGGLE